MVVVLVVVGVLVGVVFSKVYQPQTPETRVPFRKHGPEVTAKAEHRKRCRVHFREAAMRIILIRMRYRDHELSLTSRRCDYFALKFQFRVPSRITKSIGILWDLR